MKHKFLTITLTFCLSIAGAFAQKESKIGKNVYETVAQTQGFYQDQEMLGLVMEIGQNLEAQLEENYDFKYYLVDTPVPNAFATKGGYVFVTRGLLAIINTKDELAGILGHEFSHVTEKHVSKRIAVQILPLLAELPANIIGAITYKEIGDLINLPITLTSKTAVSAFSRKQESNADKLGLQLSMKAGYDPNAFIDVMNRLERDIEYIVGKPTGRSIFNDHPLTSDRVVKMREILNEQNIEATETVIGTKIIGLDGMYFGQNPAGGIIDSTTTGDPYFVHPELEIFIGFKKGWNLVNTPLALSATDEKEKSTIVLSGETEEGSPAELGERFVSKLGKKSNLISKGSVDLNGLPAYQVTFQNHKIKYPDVLMYVYWISIPTGGLIKVIGATNMNNPNEEVLSSLKTVRSAVTKDLEETSYQRVRLKPVNEGESVDDVINRLDIQNQKLIKVINGDGIPKKGNYVKVLEEKPLID